MKPVSPSPADKAIPSPRKGNIFLYRFRHDLTKNNYLYNVFLLKVKIMKKILSLALAAVLTSTACKDNTPNRFDGVIVDASMNTVTVKALTGDDTHTFSLEEADKTDANGLLIGNLISVTYQGKMSEVTPATQVTTDATYAKAIGKWTMPDPIDSTKRMGVELQIEGKAGSINMATLPIESWELQGEADKVILKGRSIGNGQTSDYTQTATIVEKDGKTFLSLDGTETVLEKEN